MSATPVAPIPAPVPTSQPQPVRPLPSALDPSLTPFPQATSSPLPPTVNPLSTTDVLPVLPPASIVAPPPGGPPDMPTTSTTGKTAAGVKEVQEDVPLKGVEGKDDEKKVKEVVVEEEEVDCGKPGLGAVVDMEVFGQLLEIVSFSSFSSLGFGGSFSASSGQMAMEGRRGVRDEMSWLRGAGWRCDGPGRAAGVAGRLYSFLAPLSLFTKQDDDDTHEFSKMLAFDYISQANTTFTEIEDALNTSDLSSLSRKGHFLKGSSAALGLQKVQHSCESMQHFGNRRNEFGEGEELSEKEALGKCRALLKRLRSEQEEARVWLEKFYS